MCETVRTTILEIVRYRKLCARCVPGMLMVDCKVQRVLTCGNLLKWYETMDDFLDNIITGDETWVHH